MTFLSPVSVPMSVRLFWSFFYALHPSLYVAEELLVSSWGHGLVMGRESKSLILLPFADPELVLWSSLFLWWEKFSSPTVCDTSLQLGTGVCVCNSWWPHCFERGPALTCTVLLEGWCTWSTVPKMGKWCFFPIYQKVQHMHHFYWAFLMKVFLFFFLKQMKKHPCRQCDKSFSSSHSLCRHNRIKHKGIRKVYTCS